MKVTIPIEFEVTARTEGDELTEGVVKIAAELAVYHFLAFVMVSGQTSDVENVEVHVDGFGSCIVSLVEED